jgi:hypothetical protein
MKAATWTTRDGRVIKIKDMSDGHLVNTIKYLERNAPQIRSRLYRGLCSFASRLIGEMAMVQVDKVLEVFEETDAIDIMKEYTPYDTLVWHAKRRKLPIN